MPDACLVSLLHLNAISQFEWASERMRAWKESGCGDPEKSLKTSVLKANYNYTLKVLLDLCFTLHALIWSKSNETKTLLTCPKG